MSFSEYRKTQNLKPIKKQRKDLFRSDEYRT